MDILVEDDIAETILRLGMPHHLRERVRVVPIGSSGAVLCGLATKYLEGSDNCICVLDGDKRNENARSVSLFKSYVEGRFRESDQEATTWIGERLAYLPSRKTPEQWLIQSCLKHDEKSRLASAWGVEDTGVIDSWLKNALKQPRHSEFYAISKDVLLEKEEIVADLVRFLVFASPEVLNKVTKQLAERLGN